MKQKKYALKFGLSLSLLVPLVAVLKVSGILHDSSIGTNIIDNLFVVLTTPIRLLPNNLFLNKYQNDNFVTIFFAALIIWFLIGVIIGYLYEKIKSPKK